eukprot:Blabericola_migrator_1__6166@NODE_310_length_10075_cov_31_389488_g253_i0_p2_GENE_NODE_310_length_10075_cov_31_389488_g253_i0NODE_310_length_10075_cov_31_389488_g253_i0_p2_ORF_typecomplete_len768_score85_61GIT1_C/PF12205_8/0_34_NODE_310_length_10075_cov_31_389488_g253_i0832386
MKICPVSHRGTRYTVSCRAVPALRRLIETSATAACTIPMLVQCPTAEAVRVILDGMCDLTGFEWRDCTAVPHVWSTVTPWKKRRLHQHHVSRQSTPTSRPHASERCLHHCPLPPPVLVRTLSCSDYPVPHSSSPNRGGARRAVLHQDRFQQSGEPGDFRTSFANVTKELVLTSRSDILSRRQQQVLPTNFADLQLAVSRHLHNLLHSKLQLLVSALQGGFLRSAHTLQEIKLVGKFFDADLMHGLLAPLGPAVPNDETVAQHWLNMSSEDLHWESMSLGASGTVLFPRLLNVEGPMGVFRDIYAPQLRSARLPRVTQLEELLFWLGRHSTTLRRLNISIQPPKRPETSPPSPSWEPQDITAQESSWEDTLMIEDQEPVLMECLKHLQLNVATPWSDTMQLLTKHILAPQLTCLKLMKTCSVTRIVTLSRTHNPQSIMDSTLKLLAQSANSLQHLCIESQELSSAFARGGAFQSDELLFPNLRALRCSSSVFVRLLATSRAAPQLQSFACTRSSLRAESGPLQSTTVTMTRLLEQMLVLMNQRPSLKCISLPSMCCRNLGPAGRRFTPLCGRSYYVEFVCIGDTGFDICHSLPPCEFSAAKAVTFTPIVPIADIAPLLASHFPVVEEIVFYGGVAVSPGHPMRLERVRNGLRRCKRLHTVSWPADLDVPRRLLDVLSDLNFRQDSEKQAQSLAWAQPSNSTAESGAGSESWFYSESYKYPKGGENNNSCPQCGLGSTGFVLKGSGFDFSLVRRTTMSKYVRHDEDRTL